MVNYDKLHIVVSSEETYKSKQAIENIIYTLYNERKIDKQTFRLRHGSVVDEAINYLFSQEEKPFDISNTLNCIELEGE